MFESVLLLSAAVTGAVEFLKSVLMTQKWFTNFQDETQSVILQVIAFLAGILAAFSGGVNVFAALPAFATTPSWVGIIITGLIAGTGSAGIHALLALIGVRGSVVAQVQTAKAQAAVGKSTYAPYL